MIYKCPLKGLIIVLLLLEGLTKKVVARKLVMRKRSLGTQNGIYLFSTCSLKKSLMYQSTIPSEKRTMSNCLV
jgi:hypothetical protein